MKIKTSTLIGKQLDYAVAKCEGGMDFWYDTIATYWIKINGKDRALSAGWGRQSFTPSTDWSYGGTIIEQEKIRLDPREGEWQAKSWENYRISYGPTALIAAMRCYVQSKLGDEVEIPDELI